MEQNGGDASKKIVEVLMINSTSGPGLLFPKVRIVLLDFKQYAMLVLMIKVFSWASIKLPYVTLSSDGSDSKVFFSTLYFYLIIKRFANFLPPLRN